MSVVKLAVHRWSRAEYERMGAAGVFHPEIRVELVRGEIYEMAPQSAPHAACVSLIQEALQRVLPTGYHLRVQLPLAVGDDSEPEPDLAIVSGSPRDYRGTHPERAILVIEVADSSLAYDRTIKREAYETAGIAEYWIVNLKASSVEVFRSPVEGKYQAQTTLSENDSIGPAAFPRVRLALRELLP